MSNILELINKKRIYFDGGMGSMLQKRGLGVNEHPEEWNLTHSEIITDIHREYLKSGANIITTNTFGINALKYDNYDIMIESAICCARNATNCAKDSFIAFDIGPLGRFIEPIGDLPFEDAVEIFAKNIRVAQKCGIDLILIETMTDSLETKAAVIAAKENSSAPIFVTNVYDENCKTLTGADPESMVAMLEGLGVSALGVNCSLGPDKLVDVIERIYKVSSLPIIANPNAGIPKQENGVASYTMDAASFAHHMRTIAQKGANLLGGCCGTDPEYIKALVEATRDIPLNPISNKDNCVISSYTHAINIDKSPILIGERINPTGKPKLKQALIDSEYSYILQQALIQADAGAHILDINVGLPTINERDVMKRLVPSIQSICDLPLSLDSNDPETLEASMRIYNGKPLINSVNGDIESMDKIFPLIKKYGGVVIALTLDKNGIPRTSEGRVEIAERILKNAGDHGVSSNDIIFDPLALTVATDPKNMDITLDTVSILHDRGLKTSLGISNISFGMPERDKINSLFFAKAIKSGLSCAIINPLSSSIMNVYRSKDKIYTGDFQITDYDFSVDQAPRALDAVDISLKDMIIRGLSDAVKSQTEALIEIYNPLQIINNEIIPALNKVGEDFEKQIIFLPQLLKSAECASHAFDIIKSKMKDIKGGSNSVIIATVKGDVHDIGKNIVKLLLESYGFTVYDLGKNVETSEIINALKLHRSNVVALSALMTTTLPAMQESVVAIHEYDPKIKVMVGGAVLTQEFANMIGADAYADDAMDAVKIVRNFYNL